MDSWVGCTLNKGIQPKGQVGAEIQLVFPLQSHPLCGLAGSCLPTTHTPSLHSPALQTVTEDLLRLR